MGKTDAHPARDSLPLELPPLLTTATKTPRPFRDSPVPASVVTSREMRMSGAATLKDVLAEQTGLNLVQDHGSGVQIQGLSPDYTLILVDGEPAVGRTAGTLNLERFKVGGIDQVEIVRGPSSSLYGSEALGGVVNLVTRRPVDPFSTAFRSRYGTHHTMETSASLEAAGENTGFSVFADRTASNGFDLDPARRGQSAPAYANYTVQPKLVLDHDQGSRFTISPRFFRETQLNTIDHVANGDTLPASERSELDDWGLSASAEHRVSPTLGLTLKGYATRYKARSGQISEADGTLLYNETFEQQYRKSEALLRSGLGAHTLLAGTGGVFESVRADYVEGGEHGAFSGFAFVQDEWIPRDWANLQASGRLDAHDDYGMNFSPRLAGLLRPLRWMTVKASAGSGFKAPTFQELYLNFTNPQVGYTVFGATGAGRGMQTLRSQGQIAAEFQSVEDSRRLTPEKSRALNAGVEFSTGSSFTLSANIFQNHVRDLIESSIIARKTNGQNVYTYFNLHRIQTRGLETEASFKPRRWLSLSAGYQYLRTLDEDAVDSIRAGRIYKVGSTGVARPVQMVEYGGLLNRPRHSGNVKAALDFDKPGFSAQLRGIFRGRYGYADFNGNKILDDDREYARGFALWNLTLSQRLSRFVSLEAGMENLADERAPVPLATTDPAIPIREIPSLPGRILRAGIEIRYF